ncbi:hypothetical protein [Flexivirga meconopsidis]|uniref:hypothetical protein n=1 Tax=Flexivirga meconopsidis TaxID=2977121 RepID=UPI00224040A7|nr:hypothetical protein [Flexivirga meconopsidis]
MDRPKIVGRQLIGPGSDNVAVRAGVEEKRDRSAGRDPRIHVVDDRVDDHRTVKVVDSPGCEPVFGDRTPVDREAADSGREGVCRGESDVVEQAGQVQLLGVVDKLIELGE